jgi:transposase
MIKILFWDRTGYCQYFKRLENGTFSFPVSTADGPRSMTISFDTLRLLLDGIDILGVKRM